MKKICRAAIFLASFAVAAQAEPCCQTKTLADADLDGDGIVDVIHRSSDSGSAMATTSVDLVLSRTGKRIEIVLDYSYSEMVGAEDVPAELLAPGMERVLEAVEAALFGCVCQEPDPSLAWLLESDKGPRSLRWVAGPPVLPDSYTLREKGAIRWLSYGGGAHRGLTRKVTEPEIERLATDPRTGYVLGRTAHGVLLIDDKGSRHAWLYVTRDGGGQKLRFPTVVGGRLEEGRAVIRLSHEQAFYGDYECGLLRIDLRDGSYAERWRGLTDAGMEKCWDELEKASSAAAILP